ncbi:MAG: GNAT family N-acetyltransferase [Parvularculaceae bacterium]|nr:GNAT family N-acetyltransferase [Parvularculaceae bacterium]
MKVRQAVTGDAEAMSEVLREIVVQTGRQRSTEPALMISNYIDHPERVRCSVAVDENNNLIGFQSLVRSWPDNSYGVPLGWGIVGTHISPRAHRRGVGKALFAVTKVAAEAAGLLKIDAYIGADNPGALSYYEAMGFRTYRENEDVVQKAYMVGGGEFQRTGS